MINENTIRKTCQDLADLLVRKNHDYGNSVQEQFNEYGLTSLLIRLDDKLRRLKTLKTKEGQVHESVADTLKDLAGYAMLGLLCLEDAPLPEVKYEYKPVTGDPLSPHGPFISKSPFEVEDIFQKLKKEENRQKAFMKAKPHAYFDADDQH